MRTLNQNVSLQLILDRGSTTVSIPESGTVKSEPYQRDNSSTPSTNVICSPDAHYKSTDNEASLGWTEVPTKTTRNRKALVPDETKTRPEIKTAPRSSKKPFENRG